MSVKIIDNEGLWDRFVDDSPHGTLFHRWKFLEIVERHSGFRLLPYGVYRGSELICVFPVFHKSYGGMRMVFSPPPRTQVPNLGPIMSPKYDGFRQSKKESYLYGAIDEINEEIAKLSPNYTFVSTALGMDDARPFQWSAYDVRVNYTYVLSLERSLEEIRGGFSPDCRQSIKACEKLPLAIKQTSDVRTFYDIIHGRLEDKGLNPAILGEDYLKDILEAFPDNARMFFVYCGEEITSVSLHCEYRGSLMFWMGNVNLRRDIPSNEYAMWEFIKDAKARGFREVEFEGAALRQLCQYKAKFNPSLRQHYYIFKKDIRGSVAEWAYRNILTRKILAGK
jgi:hypothetical protein